MGIPGQRLAGRYELEKVVGIGGYGCVWKAKDHNLALTVAIKEIHGGNQIDEARLVRQAKRETQLAAELRENPHVVSVYDVFVSGQTAWIVMEYVAGSTLEHAVLAQHPVVGGGGTLPVTPPLPAERVKAIAVAMLDALRSARDRGILHRDVKPANILLADDGRVLLADFGISRLRDTVRETKTGVLHGTPAYVAPERFGGDDDNPQSDLFSLGAALYFALVGVSPFLRESPQATMHAVLAAEIMLPGDFGELGKLVSGLLAKDPAARPTAFGEPPIGEDPGPGADGVNEKLASLIATVAGLDIAEVRLETPIRTHPQIHAALADIAVAVEAAFGVTVPARELTKWRTIGDIADYVRHPVPASDSATKSGDGEGWLPGWVLVAVVLVVLAAVGGGLFSNHEKASVAMVESLALDGRISEAKKGDCAYERADGWATAPCSSAAARWKVVRIGEAKYLLCGAFGEQSRMVAVSASAHLCLALR